MTRIGTEVAPSDEMMRCEQKKEFLIDKVSRETEWRWVEVHASRITGVPRDRLRCVHCHGAVRLHRQQVEHGPRDHVEHLSRQDSENCRGGHYFRGEHRMSLQPMM